jgi:hypothetical protein
MNETSMRDRIQQQRQQQRQRQRRHHSNDNEDNRIIPKDANDHNENDTTTEGYVNAKCIHHIAPLVILFMLFVQCKFLVIMLDSAESYNHPDAILPKQSTPPPNYKQLILAHNTAATTTTTDPWWAPAVDSGMDATVQHPHSTAAERTLVYEDTMLIISCTLTDQRYLAALWSALECAAPMYERVHLALPDWSRDVMEAFVHRARMELPQLRFSRHYVMYTRWDMGLWCDVLDLVDPSKYIVLLTDSVFFTRPHYSKLLTLLMTDQYDMVGMTAFEYEGEYYVEQFMRGFTRDSIQVFRNYTCVAIFDASFGYHVVNLNGQHEHVLFHHERQVDKIYARDRVTGIFPANPPPDDPLGVLSHNKTWETSDNLLYWMRMRDEQEFPLAKVNRPRHVPKQLNLPHLKVCTTRVNATFFSKVYRRFPELVEIET